MIRPIPPRRTGAGRSLRPFGFGLLEGLIAVLILSLGLLGLARWQTSLMAQTTEAQSRVRASALADELLSTVLVDAGNAGCYTLPQSGTCGSATATARATEWQARALAALPGATAPTSTLDITTRRFTVTLNWTGKASRDPHQLEMSTDAR
jgi:type IV pilus assembly protein PilV